MKVMSSGDHHWNEGSRLDECTKVHAFMVDVARREGVGLFISCGDVYERASTPLERRLVAEWLTAMADVCPCVVIRGNHDRRSDLEIMSRLKTRHPVVVVENARVVYVAGVAVAAMAWPERAELAAAFAGQSTQQLDATAQELLQNVLRGLGAELAGFAGPVIGAGHWNIDGSVTSTGQPLIGHSMNVGLADLALLRAPLVVAAHIHMPQQWTHGDVDIAFSGSPYRTSFGETEEKGVILADYDGAKLVSWHRIATPCTRMFLGENEWGDIGDGSRGFMVGWRGLPSPSEPAQLVGAEVRLRYKVPADCRAEAATAASVFRAALLACGASNVKVDPQVIAVGTARAPAVAAAPTLEGKLLAYWAARGTTPAAERSAALISKATGLDVGGDSADGGGNVRFDGVRLKGLGPFKREVDLDIAGIAGQLVAVVGPNGAGKSTLLELLAGALYRDTPTRGTLADLATSRDAFVEARVVNGAAYTIRQSMDGVSRAGESLVLDAAGVPQLETTKVSAFDKWAPGHIVAADILYSTSFAAQRARGFLDMSATERKQLLIKMLRLERLERIAKAAGEQAKAAKAALDVQRGLLAATPSPDVGNLERLLEAAQARCLTADAAARDASTALSRARAAAGDAARGAELAEQRRAARARLTAAEGQIAAVRLKITNNQALLARADEVTAAVETARGLDSSIASTRTVDAAHTARLAEARAEEAAARVAHAKAAQALALPTERMTRLGVRLKDREAVMAAAVDAAEWCVMLGDVERGLDASHARAAELETLVLTAKDWRITGLRSGLANIAESDGAGHWAAQTLTQDDERADTATQAPAELASIRSFIVGARTKAERLRRDVAEAQRLAARLGEIQQAETDLLQTQGDILVAAASAEAAKVSWDSAVSCSGKAAASAKSSGDLLASLVNDRAAIESAVALYPTLQQAQGRIADLISAQEPLRATIAQAEGELAALPEIAADAIDVEAYERAVAAASQGADRARDDRSRAQTFIEQGRACDKRRAEIAAEVSICERESSDWTRLTQDLGRDGLQAMEIDAALPELNTMANDLLSQCYGTRFTVELKTDRLSADGKKVVEGLAVRVLDTENGRDADADTYSGGECVIVGSAVSLALTMLACRRASGERPTLVLDEAGAALDAENGRAWIKMLRLAATQIGADKVLFTCHSEEMKSMADAWIVVADGGATVQAVQ